MNCIRAVQLHAGRPEARHYTSLGMANALLNRPAEAEAAYRQALVIDPTDNDANYRYGVLPSGIGQWDRAKPYLDHVCRAGLEPACKRLRP